MTKVDFEAPRLIMGIDPGTKITGYGLIEVKAGGRVSAVDFGCVRPPAKLPLSDRYLIIHEGVESLLKKYAPSACVFETQFFREINPKSILKLGMAYASALLAAKRCSIDVFEYSPTNAKKAVVGYGRASKEQVQGMLQKILALKSLPTPFDAADALALAVCHVHHI